MKRFLLLMLMFGCAASLAAAPATMSNPYIRAEFNDSGLAVLTDVVNANTFRFTDDAFTFSIDGRLYRSEELQRAGSDAAKERVTYRYSAPPYQVELVYELRPGWKFLSKQIFIRPPEGRRFRVERVEVFRSAIQERLTDVYVRRINRVDLQTKDYGAFLRFGRYGLLVTAQNPFLEFQRDAGAFSLSYPPNMEWRAEYGPFACDRGLLAPYLMSRRRVADKLQPEWKLDPPEDALSMDEAEVDAFVHCVRSFLLYKPEKPLNLFVGWCVNDYQIDAATEEGRKEYKRIIAAAAELGATHVLYAPANSLLSRKVDSNDDWGWENLLWLGLGQKIRRNEWNVKTDPIPPSVEEMLDYAKSKNVKLVAYVYPIMGFTQSTEWQYPRGGTRKGASLGVRSFQDWLTDAMVAFAKRTGLGGYAFDHTYLGAEGTSRYAQWYGWKRVMEELRRQIPDIAIDGRQAYHLYGPWTWLAGSYPHPTSSDEQPESFAPFPDLHFDRVSANRTRFANYRYRNLNFTPPEIMPGYITHQTPRNDDTGRLPMEKRNGDNVPLPFRLRDWDYLGWRYSLLSSIATAGFNNVLDMIPARDLEEHKNFSAADKRWFRQWLDWTAKNTEYLHNTRTILNQPVIGKIDGTSAISGRKGFVFLFNPNGRRLTSELPLDASIGLDEKGRYLVKELYPLEGRLVGRADGGVFNYGERVALPMEGASALVLEISPAPETTAEPVLFNVPGKAALRGGTLELAGVRAEVGTYQNIMVWLPKGAEPEAVSLNGRRVKFTQNQDHVSLAPRFEGVRFSHMQALGEDPFSAPVSGRGATGFSGKTFDARFNVPGRIFKQLAARRQAWPIPWTEEDLKCTWLAPERLLLFVQIAEPNDTVELKLTIDGKAVELKKAYSSIRVNKNSFVGFYADLSKIEPDREHTLRLELPDLRPGQFQGVFFDNVETEYTTDART